jgi:hypothetical protein
MSITNDNRQDEWSGGTGYNVITATNSKIEVMFGFHYLDIRRVLVESYNPDSVVDVSDNEHDEIPTSLRGIIYDNITLVNAIGPSDTTFVVNSPNKSPLEPTGVLTDR